VENSLGLGTKVREGLIEYERKLGRFDCQECVKDAFKTLCGRRKL